MEQDIQLIPGVFSRPQMDTYYAQTPDCISLPMSAFYDLKVPKMTIEFDIKRAPPTQESIDEERQRLSDRYRRARLWRGAVTGSVGTAGFASILATGFLAWPQSLTFAGFLCVIIAIVIWETTRDNVSSQPLDDLAPIHTAAAPDMLAMIDGLPEAERYRNQVLAMRRPFVRAEFKMIQQARQGLAQRKAFRKLYELHS